MAPPQIRAQLLEMIQEDIDSFGGGYNWTTGWKSDEIDVEQYNSFFSRHNNNDFVRKLELIQ